MKFVISLLSFLAFSLNTLNAKVLLFEDVKSYYYKGHRYLVFNDLHPIHDPDCCCMYLAGIIYNDNGPMGKIELEQTKNDDPGNW